MNTSDRSTVNAITKLIFVEDEPAQADLIIIPGTMRSHLAEKAAELYSQGYAKRILCTGGVNSKLNMNECEFAANILLKSGVNQDDILLESESTNTKENAHNALILLKQNKLDHSRIILISKPYHARRLLMTFKKSFTNSILYVIPVEDDRQITKNNWFETSDKKEIVMNELRKIAEYYLKGDISF